MFWPRKGRNSMRYRFGGGPFVVLFGRPDGFGSSDFAQIVNLFMFYVCIYIYIYIWGSGADFIKKMMCVAE